MRADDAGELAQEVREEAEDLDLRVLQVEVQRLALVLHRLQRWPCGASFGTASDTPACRSAPGKRKYGSSHVA